MKKEYFTHLATLIFLGCLHQAAGQGTAFTYQGRLYDAGSAAGGNCDFQHSLTQNI